MALRRIKGSGITDGTVGADDLESTLDLSGKTVTLPAASVTAHVTQFDDNQLKEEIALLGFRTAANGSLAKYNLIDQTIDDFQDTSGVDAGASTNEVRDSSGKYYKGESAVTPSVSGNYDDSGVDGDYSWYKWTTVTASGSYTTDTAQDYEYLVVAGGGGGGPGDSSSSMGAGGGGAGGYRTDTGFSVSGTVTVTVGAAGVARAASSKTAGGDGGNSVFSSITSTGGGGGGARDYPAVSSQQNGRDGGSGGGAAGHAGSAGSGNTPSTSPVQGYDGGGRTAAANGGSGGGGSSAAAPNNPGDHSGGAAGAGTANSITGASVTYAVGGTGGPGSTGSPDGSDAAANTGSGGGGGANASASGAGGSGIVIIRRETSPVTEGANLTLVSTTTTAQTAPTKGDIVFTYTNGAGTTTLGGGSPDVTAEYSADGGSTWTSMALASEGSTGGHNIATAHDVTLTSTSGTSMAYRIKTLNQSASKTTRIQAVSLGWS